MQIHFFPNVSINETTKTRKTAMLNYLNQNYNFVIVEFYTVVGMTFQVESSKKYCAVPSVSHILISKITRNTTEYSELKKYIDPRFHS